MRRPSSYLWKAFACTEGVFAVQPNLPMCTLQTLWKEHVTAKAKDLRAANESADDDDDDMYVYI